MSRTPSFAGSLPNSRTALQRTLDAVRSSRGLEKDMDNDDLLPGLGLPSSQNNGTTNDDCACPDPGALPVYRDIDQPPMNRTDANADRPRDYKWLLLTTIRGRSTPVKPLFVAVTWTVTAVLITWFTSKNYKAKDGECRHWCTPVAVNSDALSYVGFALFLLTSFRVGEAYSRYMEAVRTWTNIAGTVTSMAKYIVQAFPRNAFHEGDRERILSFLVAFPVALKRELRNERDLRELKSVLAAADLARLQQADSMSSYCLYVLSSYALHFRREEGRLPQTFVIHIIGWIADLSGYASVCTQIKKMPAPYSYVTHLNNFLWLWLFFLPFAIVESTGWGTIVIVTFIAYGILGVVANAEELEDPFGNDYNDLPLGRTAEEIQKQVKEIYKAGFTARTDIVCHVPDENLHRANNFWLDDEAGQSKAFSKSDSTIEIEGATG